MNVHQMAKQPGATRTVRQILYEGGSVRQMSLAELSMHRPVLLVLVPSIELLPDPEELSGGCGPVDEPMPVLVVEAAEEIGERALIARGLTRHQRIIDPRGKVRALFDAAGATEPLLPTALIEGGRITCRSTLRERPDRALSA